MLYQGILIGIIGGLMSGTLGVSSGGALVPLSVLLLGADQRVAQAISLIAQIFPTSLSGLRHYARSGHGVTWRSLAFIGSGFVGGGIAGALLASGSTDKSLRWGFVGYLVLLEVVLLARPPRARHDLPGGATDEARSGTPEAARSAEPPARLSGGGLVVVGLVAGMSSGLLGIGGGLAITALGSAFLKLRQHQAQALSLATTALPLTLPAAWSYVHEGTQVPALAIAGIVAGLWVGTSMGSRIANWLSARTLRYALILLVAAMALFMAWKAGHAAEGRDQAATGAGTVVFAATRSASCRVHSAIFTASQPNSVRTAVAVCIPWGSPRSTIALTPML
jgi:uncharacterized membrane protein YfcA